MDESNKPKPNFDLTTPNIEPVGGQRPPPAAANSDKTTINRPVPRNDYPGDASPRRPPSPANNYDLTSVQIGVPLIEEEERATLRPPVAPPPAVGRAPQVATQPGIAPPTVKRKDGIPMWGWLAMGGVGIFALVAVIGAFLYFSANKAFTLRVLNAPPGSRVFIDDVPSGVPQRDGTILVQGLRAREPREVRVVQDGFAEWSTTVTGTGGETMDVTAKMTGRATTLPNEIEYNSTMVLVATGAFTMGDTINPDEQPLHEVTLPAYYIDKHEVTNEQYSNFCVATAHAIPADPFWSPNYFREHPRMPVMGIAYTDAVAYATWAGKRLPTEAEWEKAASWSPTAGSKRRWAWGEVKGAGKANLTSEHPSIVGEYTAGASAYGAHDMIGNAREWVDGIYRPYPGNTTANPKYGQNLRVARGGDFRADLDFARTTSRLAVDPAFHTTPEDAASMRSSLIGFRCAVSADDPKAKPAIQKASK